MRNIIAVVCVAASAMVAAAASAQSPADERPAPAADTRADIERLQSELEQARATLEAAARDLASRPVPAVSTVVGSNGAVLFGGAGGPLTPLGAALVDAEGGALVTQVVPGGGAAQAGIEVGDVIQSIDGFDLSADGSPNATILERLADVEPGDSVALAVERAGDVLEYDVAIAEPGTPWISVTRPLENRLMVLSDQMNFNRLNPTAIDLAEPPSRAPGAVVFGNPGIQVYGVQPLRSLDFATSAWGEMELVTMTDGLARYFGSDEGLLVIRGPSDESIGIEDGDVILAIGGRSPNSPEHAIRILSSFESDETIEFSIMREGQRVTVEYTVPQQQSSGLRRTFINLDRIENAQENAQ